jgi:negative regulator of sigma-B (phosphoserine phosphatase)
MNGGPTEVIEWAVRNQAHPDESESGDLHVASLFPGGALLGLIDGLGHGPEATAAAHTAAAVLLAAPSRSPTMLLQACHEALRPTRGAVLSLCSIDDARGAMTWTGVGNVEAVLFRADPSKTPTRLRIVLRGGVVGYQLPALRATEHAIYPGDLLVFASDGLRHDFSEETDTAGPADQIADRMMRSYAKRTDDAAVLVARYRGGSR